MSNTADMIKRKGDLRVEDADTMIGVIEQAIERRSEKIRSTIAEAKLKIRDGIDFEYYEHRLKHYWSCMEGDIAKLAMKYNKPRNVLGLEELFFEVTNNLRVLEEQKGINLIKTKKLELPNIESQKFSGEFREWQSFKELFEEYVHNNKDISNSKKMSYLKSCLQGDARLMVSHLITGSGANYNTAWELLARRYDNVRKQFNDNIEKQCVDDIRKPRVEDITFDKLRVEDITFKKLRVDNISKEDKLRVDEITFEEQGIFNDVNNKMSPVGIEENAKDEIKYLAERDVEVDETTEEHDLMVANKKSTTNQKPWILAETKKTKEGVKASTSSINESKINDKTKEQKESWRATTRREDVNRYFIPRESPLFGGSREAGYLFTDERMDLEPPDEEPNEDNTIKVVEDGPEGEEDNAGESNEESVNITIGEDEQKLLHDKASDEKEKCTDVGGDTTGKNSAQKSTKTVAALDDTGTSKGGSRSSKCSKFDDDKTKKDEDKKIRDTTSKTRDDKRKTIDTRNDASKKPEVEKDKQRDKEKEKDYNKRDIKVNETIEIAEIDPVGKADVVTTIWELLIPWQLALKQTDKLKTKRRLQTAIIFPAVTFAARENVQN
ncbi:uncharacterized protein LOC125780340 [Bactrocera dorsalis]|uniref:Uncharacterized protein LOC125780340 n=1 Tax=Bactrocera dorsalis TaxID=27457 RepID=A0ABM3KAJ4_BACDO|nr:uncharacterized protein LOC125780340 [Bactrocera dorsalis]